MALDSPSSPARRPAFSKAVTEALARFRESADLLPLDYSGVLERRRRYLGTLRDASADFAVTRVDHVVPVSGDAVMDVSVITPDAATGPAAPAIFWVHGGGMISGHRLGGLSRILPWAVDCGATVITPEYRLAPENPHPTPVGDVYSGLQWTRQHADLLGIDPNRIVIAGASAGAGIAAGVTLLVREEGAPRLAGQLLMCPMLDDQDRTPSTIQFDGVGLWDRASNRFGWECLLGASRGTASVDQFAAPSRALDLSELPATFIDVGSAEVFRDECVDYATRIWLAGGNAELHVWPGGTHGWDELTPDDPMAIQASAARATWLARVFEGEI